MEIIKKKNVLSKIIFGKDNDSYMLNDFNDYSKCNICNTPLEKKINPNFRLNKQKYDISHTYDGFTIVSANFKRFCEEQALIGLKFIQLHYNDNFYVFFSDNFVELDHKLRKTQFKDRCDGCKRYLSVSGSSPNFLKKNDENLLNTIYRSNIEYGYKNEQSPILIVKMTLYKKIQFQKFEGLCFSDILDKKSSN